METLFPFLFLICLLLILFTALSAASKLFAIPNEAEYNYTYTAGYTTMEVPNEEYAKLSFIRDYGVEAFVESAKRGEWKND